MAKVHGVDVFKCIEYGRSDREVKLTISTNELMDVMKMVVDGILDKHGEATGEAEVILKHLFNFEGMVREHCVNNKQVEVDL